VGVAALLITLGTAIGITSQRSRVTIEGADPAKLATADSLDKILRKNPNDVKALVELGNVYYDTKNFADAISFYDKALAKDSTLVDVAVDRAVALDQAGHPDQAVHDLETIVARHPDHAIAAFDLAVIYEFQGRKEDAAREYKDAAAKATSADVQHVATMRLKPLEGTMPTPPPQP
jgi:tetratricopeptide (TPR) repeat protein